MQGMAGNGTLSVMIINKDKLTDYSETVTYVTPKFDKGNRPDFMEVIHSNTIHSNTIHSNTMYRHTIYITLVY